MARGVQSDDNQLSDRQVAFIINYYRAKLVKEQVEKSKSMTTYEQNLGRVELIRADVDECCDEGCVLRTKLKIPDVLTVKTGELLTYVGLVGGSQAFQRTRFQAVTWDKYRRYTSNMTRWYISNDYIYIINNPTHSLKYINVRGVFSDPQEAIKFRTCDCEGNEEQCYDGFDFPYPLEDYLIDVLYKLMAQTELSIYASGLVDTANDTMDLIKPPTDARAGSQR